MMTDQDLDRLLDRWFAQRQVKADGRIVDVVAGRIERQRQRPAWRLRSWREAHMNAYTKPLSAMAAVVVVAVAGYALLGGSAGESGAGGSTSSPSPTASPSSVFQGFADRCGNGAPTCAGPLSPGEHASLYFEPAFTYWVNGDWYNTIDTAGTFELTTSSQAVDDPFLVMGVGGPNPRCRDFPTPGAGISVAGWIEAIVAQPHLEASAPTPVNIGGAEGQSIDLWGSPEMCPRLPKGAYPGRVRLLVVDVRGTIVLIAMVNNATTDQNFEAAMSRIEPFVDSIRFLPR